jgi:GNAT superfamily N-acetyltransferase
MRHPLGSEPPPRGEIPDPQAGGSEQPAWSLDAAGQARFRAMTEADLPFVVGQHLHHFPDGFFARLGRGFLTEYYRAFLTGSAARTTVAEVDREPVGYLVGVTEPSAHREHVVRRHGRALVLEAVTAMLCRPSLAMCFLRTRAGLYARKLLRRSQVSAGNAVPAAGPSAPRHAGPPAVLTHVAVAPHAQSRGIGSQLISRFDEEVAAAGCERLTLVTASGDDGAGPYYRRRGWRATGERCTPDGLLLTTYERAVQARDDRYHTRESEDTA